MEQFILVTAIAFFKNLPASNPAYLDLLKLLVVSIAWIGGMTGFIYRNQRKLKAAAFNK